MTFSPLQQTAFLVPNLEPGMATCEDELLAGSATVEMELQNLLNEECENHNTNSQRLVAKHTIQQHEYNWVQADVIRMQRERQSQQEELQLPQLQGEQLQLQDECQSLRLQLEQMKTELHERDEQIESLKQECFHSKSEVKKLESRIDTLQIEMEVSKIEVSWYKEELVKNNREMERVQSAREEEFWKMAALEKKKLELEKRVAVLEQERALQNAIERIQKEEYERCLHNAQQEKESVHRQLQNLNSSQLEELERQKAEIADLQQRNNTTQRKFFVCLSQHFILISSCCCLMEKSDVTSSTLGKTASLDPNLELGMATSATMQGLSAGLAGAAMELPNLFIDERMKCENHKSGYQVLKAKNTSQQHEYNWVQAEVNHMLSERQSQQEELRGEQLDNTREQENLQLQAERQSLRLQLEQMKSELHERDKQIESLNQECFHFKREVKKLESRIDILQVDMMVLKVVVWRYREMERVQSAQEEEFWKMAALQKEKLELEKRVAALEQERALQNAIERTQKEEYEKRLHNAQQEKESVRRELQNLRMKLQQLAAGGAGETEGRDSCSAAGDHRPQRNTPNSRDN
ncbi:uncharacterized protein KZ484_021287 [Pholidichthys leucotaenia]